MWTIDLDPMEFFQFDTLGDYRVWFFEIFRSPQASKHCGLLILVGKHEPLIPFDGSRLSQFDSP
jgi:hypothetical protein